MLKSILSSARRCVLLGVALAVGGVAAQAVPYPNPWPSSSYLYRQYGTGNTGMNARVFVPIGYDASNATKYPVVVFAHGDGEIESGFVAGNPNVYNSRQMTDNGQYAFVTPANQAQFPCFFVQIQRAGPSNSSDNSVGAAAVLNVINSLGAEFKTTNGGVSKVDLDRVIMTGLSGGGGTTLSVVNFYSSSIAAAVVLSPASPSLNIANFANLPMWYYVSQDDGTERYPISEGLVNGMRALGGKPIYTVYANGGHSSSTWGSAYANPALIPWLAAQRRGVPSTNDPATVTVTSPTTASSYTSPTMTVTIGGATSIYAPANPGLIDVRWVKGPYPVVDSYSITKPTTGGVANWTFTDSSVVNQYNPNPFPFSIVARGSSYDANRGGVTYYSAAITVVKTTTGNPDTTAPTIAISSPTTGSTYAASTASIALAGTASDNVGVTSVTWSNNRGGSGTASGTTSWTISNAALQTGNNVFTITANDAAGNHSAATLTVAYAVPNQAPTVNAGADASIQLPAQAQLNGAVSDDGLPSGSLSGGWTKISGPGTVTFGDATMDVTSAAFSAPGAYTLRLTVTDGALSASDDVNITVAAANTGTYPHLLIDLGYGGGAGVTAGNWNNLTSSALGAAVANCIDANGAATGVGISITAGFAGSVNVGTTAAGPYPASAEQDGLYTVNAMISKVKLTGLAPAGLYTVKFYASRLDGANGPDGINRVTKYAIGTSSTTLDAANNVSNVASLTAQADANGEVEISVSNATGAGYGYLGVIDAQRNSTGPTLASALSRQTHGWVGALDLNLNVNGAPTVEDRASAAGGAYKVVMTFSKPITAGTMAITAGTGTVGTVTVSGSTLTIPLTNVTDAQSLTLTATNVTPQDGGAPGSASLTFIVLEGDVTGDQVVDASDVNLIIANMGATLAQPNCYLDVSINGAISAVDRDLVQTLVGHHVP